MSTIKDNSRLMEVLIIVGLTIALLAIGYYLIFVDHSTKVDFVYNQF